MKISNNTRKEERGNAPLLHKMEHLVDWSTRAAERRWGLLQQSCRCLRVHQNSTILRQILRGNSLPWIKRNPPNAAVAWHSEKEQFGNSFMKLNKAIKFNLPSTILFLSWQQWHPSIQTKRSVDFMNMFPIWIWHTSKMQAPTRVPYVV